MNQKTFFDDWVEFSKHPAAPKDDTPQRLSKQCRQILERLRRGPASNVELAEISLKYTSRISEIRKTLPEGEVLVARNCGGGKYVYSIEESDVPF